LTPFACHAAREPHDQAHLGPEAHVRLLVLVAVRRRLDINAARHRPVVVQEDALPRHLDTIADQHRVGLVEAEAQRIIRLVAGMPLVGRARPERDAGRVDRQCAGNAFARALVVDGSEVADPHLVGEHRAGGQHFHAGDDDAAVVLGDHLQGRIVARLAGEDFPAADAGGRRYREREIEIVLARMVVVTREVGAETGGERVEQLGLHRQPRDQARDVVGRAPDQAVGRVRNRLHRAHAAGEILARTAAQPGQAVALAVFLEREQLALLRIGLELVEVGDGACGVPEGGVTGDVVHPLGADIDGAAVAHALELFFSADQHCSSVHGRLDTLAL
jgi:hypothetical protein